MCPKSREVREFGQRIRALAKALGGQKVLASYMGWSQSHTSQYCTGHRTPGWETLDEILKKTGCNPAFILGESDGPFDGDDVDRAAAGINTYVMSRGGSWVKEVGAASYRTPVPQNVTAYEVRGNMLEPLAHDGQLVIAMSGVDAKNGELALIELHDGRHMCKRIFRKSSGVVLSSINPAHEPELVQAHEIRYAWKVWGVRF